MFIRYALVAAASAAVSWEIRNRLALKQTAKLIKEFDSFDRFSRIFSAGWDAAQRQYTRYYTDEQYKLVFGVDREH